MFINMPGEEFYTQIVTDEMLVEDNVGSTRNDISDDEDDEGYKRNHNRKCFMQSAF